MEDDEDAPSPRTLHAAAERLAAYTSEEVAAGAEPMSGRFADLYAEVMHAQSAACHATSKSRILCQELDILADVMCF